MMKRILEEHLKPYLAHVRRDEDGTFAIHDLEEHVRAVGELAGEFASSFGLSQGDTLEMQRSFSPANQRCRAIFGQLDEISRRKLSLPGVSIERQG